MGADTSSFLKPLGVGGAKCSWEAYISDGQPEDPLPVVVERCQLLAVLQLLLDSSHLIGNFMCSRNLHMDREASYHQLKAKGKDQTTPKSHPMPMHSYAHTQ